MGASAGGLKALKEFFSSSSQLTNIAYLVIQHLDEKGKALALESLKRATKLRVAPLKAGQTLSAGTVYSVPPQTLVSFKDQKVSLTPARTTAKRMSVIDQLFRAVGKQFGESAVGVVLSGDASDGAQGLRELNAAGGLTMAQLPETAEHRSMPESAIAIGTVDHVLPPKALHKEIADYAGYLSPAKLDPKRRDFREEISAAITSICEVLHQRTKHDFKHYKTSTLLRRIQRRMQVLQIGTVQRYIDHLNASSDESSTLFKELLINVTSFFRDKDSFQALKEEVLEKLVREKPSDQKIRVWVAGCSTGEEAYSLAILFREIFAGRRSAPEVQILATDIDDAALAVARRGAYPATIVEHVSPERLARFFVKRGGKYHVTKELREMCLFSIHNLISDPPFSHLDLITCRNLLIYLGPHLQKKIFPVFHYALRPNGYLFLGTSETLTSHKELFKPVNAKHRIAQRRPTAIKMPSISTSVQRYLSHFQESEKISDTDLGLICQRIALDEMPLRYAAVNDEGQIVSASAGLGKYVQIPEGVFQNNIVKLALPSLRAALRSAINTAKKEKRKVTNDTCTVRVEDRVERTGIIVQPMPQLGDSSELYWIAFQNLGLVTKKEARKQNRELSEADAELIEQLEHELGLVRMELDKSVQDLEASNEELKSSNEELLSMNEELQSANEELETSKEEVQESNEALQRANSDLENLLAATQIATLFLDEEYNILGFTPAIQRIYNIRTADMGRSLFDFTGIAARMPEYPDPSLITPENPHESEVSLPDGRVFLRRILPYRNAEHRRDGLVVTFIDVTELRRSQGLFHTMANSAPVLVWIADKSRARTWFNKAWLQFTGRPMEESLGSGWINFLHPDDRQAYVELYERSFEAREPFYLEYRLKLTDGSYRWIGARGVPLFTSSGEFDGFIGACLDIHEQKRLSEAVKSSEAHFRMLVDNSPAMMWITNTKAERTYLSKKWYETTGRTPEQDLGFGWAENCHPDDREAAGKGFFSAVEAKGRITIRYRLRQRDGTYRWVVDSGLPLRSETGEFLGYIGTVVDIHDQVLFEEELRRAKDEADRAKQAAEFANESKTRFLANMSHEIRTPLSAIVGFSDLLRSRLSEDSEANSYIDRIARNSTQLGRLIDELLDLSKIEADKLEVERTAIDIDGVIEDVKSAMILRAEAKGIELSFNWLTAKPARVVTDPLRLSQILINIVGNSVKFTEKGAVSVDLAVHGDKFVARVSDTGIGLSIEHQSKIFEPFTQADSTVTRRYGGTGLGLTLAKKLSQLLGGDIRLERSVIGEGTVFVIEISIADAAERAPTGSRTPPDLAVGPDTLRGKTVLVVDDSPDNRTIVGLFLKAIGATIVEASNGQEGCDIALQGSCDLVLMDIQMPVMDGYYAMGKLQAGGYTGPVIALTAHAFKEEKDRCMAAGFAGYITKPINKTSLFNAVVGLLSR